MRLFYRTYQISSLIIILLFIYRLISVLIFVMSQFDRVSEGNDDTVMHGIGISFLIEISLIYLIIRMYFKTKAFFQIRLFGQENLLDDDLLHIQTRKYMYGAIELFLALLCVINLVSLIQSIFSVIELFDKFGASPSNVFWSQEISTIILILIQITFSLFLIIKRPDSDYFIE